MNESVDELARSLLNFKPSNYNSTDYWQFSLRGRGLHQTLLIPEFTVEWADF